MIVEAVFALIKALVSAIEFLLPDWTPLDLAGPLDTVFDAADPFLGLLAWLNLYAPIEELLAMVGVLGALWLGVHLYEGVVWLLSKLHIAGGGSN